MKIISLFNFFGSWVNFFTCCREELSEVVKLAVTCPWVFLMKWKCSWKVFYNLFRHWAKKFRPFDPTLFNWVFEPASSLSIGLFWVANNFSCFPPKNFDVVLKAALHLSIETLWLKKVFFSNFRSKTFGGMSNLNSTCP